jgi:hypothetical protein
VKASGKTLAMHVLDGKHVIDTTWRMEKRMGKGRLADRVLGAWNDERAYFGIPFSREYVRRYVLDRKHGGSVIDDPNGDYPLLTRAVEPAIWKAPAHVEREPETPALLRQALDAMLATG